MAIKKLRTGRFQIDFRDERGHAGKRIRETFDTHKEALHRHRTVVSQVSKAKREQKHFDPDIQRKTVRELASFHYEHAMAHWKPRSKTCWLPRIQTFIDWCEGQGIDRASQITKVMAMSYATYCAERFKGKSIELRLVAASSIFKTELEFAEPPCVARNPFVGVRKSGYHRKGKPRLVTTEQFAAFLDCCPEFEYHLFRLKYGGGFRIGELTNLTWPQVTERGIVLVSETGWEAKTEESEGLIHYNDIVKQSLAWFRHRTGDKLYVLDADTFGEHVARKSSVPGRPGSTFISKRFDRIKAIAEKRYPEFNWVGFTPHKLRTAYGSHLVQMGIPMTGVQGLMRHKRYQTTADSYIHVAPTVISTYALALDSVNLAVKSRDTLRDTRV